MAVRYLFIACLFFSSQYSFAGWLGELLESKAERKARILEEKRESERQEEMAELARKIASACESKMRAYADKLTFHITSDRQPSITYPIRGVNHLYAINVIDSGYLFYVSGSDRTGSATFKCYTNKSGQVVSFTLDGD
jgi:hypothetical protein